MGQSTCLPPRLSPLDGKPVLLGFGGADMSSGAGLTLLREIGRKAGLAQRLADCLHDPRDPAKVQHGLCDIIRFPILLIGAGHKDGNDATALRHDARLGIALERGPGTGPALCSQPTVSRMENLPDARAPIRMGRGMVRFCCQSFAHAPGHIAPDIDDPSDAVHGRQQPRLSNAFHDGHGFSARRRPRWRRPARRPGGAGSAAHIRRLIRQIARSWPNTEILLRADSHCGTPRVLDLCDRLGLRHIFGLSGNGRPAQTILALEAPTAARHARTPGQKRRRFRTFPDAALSSPKPRRVIARVEAGALGRGIPAPSPPIPRAAAASIFMKGFVPPATRP